MDAPGEALQGMRIDRAIPSTVFEMLFDPPLPSGASRRTQHRFTFTPSIETVEVIGYSIIRPCHVLVLTVTFEGEPPARLWRSMRVPGDDSPDLPQEDLAPASTVEVVVAAPSLGLHTLSWEW